MLVSCKFNDEPSKLSVYSLLKLEVYPLIRSKILKHVFGKVCITFKGAVSVTYKTHWAEGVGTLLKFYNMLGFKLSSLTEYRGEFSDLCLFNNRFK